MISLTPVTRDPRPTTSFRVSSLNPQIPSFASVSLSESMETGESGECRCGLLEKLELLGKLGLLNWKWQVEVQRKVLCCLIGRLSVELELEDLEDFVCARHEVMKP
ncbi:hypothetical protein DVH24_004784 [Malus domestica]|uniref:Uncharacterized protein n=1 Tax=Malus domestica TaxID=3750 RepID=A0A498ICB5_MALDO|nr:hypothetical protein DVH24_004784 [Malus domestica]